MNETKLVRSIQVAALACIADRPAAKRIPIEEELIMMRVSHRETDLENHDRGLDYDLPRLLHRRGMLKLVAGVGLAGAGLITLGACARDTGTADVNSPSGGRPPGGGAAGGVGNQRHRER